MWYIFTLLVVSTHLKNISQIGNHPQVGVKKKMKPPASYSFYGIFFTIARHLLARNLSHCLDLSSGSSLALKELLRSSTARAPVHCLNQLPQGMVCWSNPIVFRQLGPLNNTRLQPSEIIISSPCRSVPSKQLLQLCLSSTRLFPVVWGLEESIGKLWEIYV